MKEIELTNGATLIVAPSSFLNASILKGEIISEAVKGGISIPKNQKDLMGIEIDNDLITSLLSNVLVLESSDKITSRVFECAKRCQYNGEKITKELFEDPELWPVLLEIKVEVIKANVIPFFQNLPSIVTKLIGSIKPRIPQK